MSEENYLILKNGYLIDVVNEKPIEKVSIGIRGERISEISSFSDINVSKNARIIDLENKTIMPGLIDAHMHFMGWKTDDVIYESHVVPMGLKLIRSTIDAQNLIEAGFTTVRDCGSEESHPIASD